MRRRDFIKTSAAVAAGTMFPVYRWASAEQRAQIAQGLLDHVLPLVGTGWHGHMFPGAVAPFGMVQLSPDTSGLPEPKWNGQWDLSGWDHCSGYHYLDNYVLGFSHTHLQGTGAADLGDVLLMPLVEGRNWSWNTGDPGQQAEAQIKAIGEKSGWAFDEARNVATGRAFLTIESRRGLATTQSI